MQLKDQNICKISVELCVGNCCYINGAPVLLEILEEINQKYMNIEISILPVLCLENCVESPSLVINEKLYSCVSPDYLRSILNNIIDRNKRHL